MWVILVASSRLLLHRVQNLAFMRVSLIRQWLGFYDVQIRI
jgi:hypothetical protein